MLVDLYLWNGENKFPAGSFNVSGVNAQINVDGAEGLLNLVNELGGAIVYPPSKDRERYLICIGYKATKTSTPKFGQR